MKAVSLDIETLGTNSDAVVLSIGACVVTPDGVQTNQSFYSTLNIQQQIDLGRSITESTLRFWLNQPAKVQQSTFGDLNGPEIGVVLKSLFDWLSFVGFPPVYTKGPQFDAAIIDSLADSAKVDRPVHYRKWRDIRTLEEVLTWAGHEDLLIMTKELADRPAHDALADALMQGAVIHLSMGLCAMEAPDAVR